MPGHLQWCARIPIMLIEPSQQIRDSKILEKKHYRLAGPQRDGRGVSVAQLLHTNAPLEFAAPTTVAARRLVETAALPKAI